MAIHSTLPPGGHNGNCDGRIMLLAISSIAALEYSDLKMKLWIKNEMEVTYVYLFAIVVVEGLRYLD